MFPLKSYKYYCKYAYNLYQRLRKGQYVAAPTKRNWVDKEDGTQKPIGITALEDKIVQKAVTTILGIVYEPIFYDFSHGFRSGHSRHKALTPLLIARDDPIQGKRWWYPPSNRQVVKRRSSRRWRYHLS